MGTSTGTAPRCRRSTVASAPGSTRPTAPPRTSSGSRYTRTCSPRWASSEAWRKSPASLRPVSPASHTATVTVTGHLMDTGILARILDDVLEYGGDYRITHLELGREHEDESRAEIEIDRKSTRLNSSHAHISDAVFFFEKKKKILTNRTTST